MSLKIKLLLQVLLVTALAGSAGCRSSGNRQGDGTTLSAAADREGAAAGPTGGGQTGMDCGKHPPDAACCEARTLACNECRANAAQTLAAWKAACIKPVDVSKDCGAGPPVIACCSEATDECRECREVGLNQLLAWKEACADIDLLPCDHLPPAVVCCQAMIPSCEACRERNQRISAAWDLRCSGTPQPAGTPAGAAGEQSDKADAEPADKS